MAPLIKGNHCYYFGIPVYAFYISPFKKQSTNNTRMCTDYKRSRTSLMAQWLGICLPVQGTGSIPSLGRSHLPWGS